MSRIFKVRPITASSKLLAKLERLEIGVIDDDAICIMFKFDKRRYFKEECLSYSGGRWILDAPNSYPSFDELAEFIIEGDEGVCGLCTGGDGPQYECDFNELSTDTSMLSEELFNYYNWLIDNKSQIKAAVKRYAADESHYVDFDESHYVDFDDFDEYYWDDEL